MLLDNLLPFVMRHMKYKYLLHGADPLLTS
jgi:hypothetical protein